MPKISGGEAKDKPIDLDELEDDSADQRTSLVDHIADSTKNGTVNAVQHNGNQTSTKNTEVTSASADDKQKEIDDANKPKLNGYHKPTETIDLDDEPQEVTVKEEGDGLLDEFLKNETFISSENDVNDFLLKFGDEVEIISSTKEDAVDLEQVFPSQTKDSETHSNRNEDKMEQLAIDKEKSQSQYKDCIDQDKMEDVLKTVLQQTDKEELSISELINDYKAKTPDSSQLKANDATNTELDEQDPLGLITASIVNEYKNKMLNELNNTDNEQNDDDKVKLTNENVEEIDNNNKSINEDDKQTMDDASLEFNQKTKENNNQDDEISKSKTEPASIQIIANTVEDQQQDIVPDNVKTDEEVPDGSID